MVQAYSKGSKILHWSMAFIIISMLALGFSMIQSLAVWHVQAVALHKAFGVLAFVLVLIRLINRLRTVTPSLPTEISTAQKLAAKATQIGLYGAMILMPLSGYLMQSADDRPISVFGLFILPSVISPNIQLYGLFREIHGITATLFLVLITLHICAALYHGIVRCDGVLSSMTTDKQRAKQTKEQL